MSQDNGMQKKLGRNKQYALNMITSILSMGISVAISFFLSPYIVRNIGAEANAYISISTQIVSYVSLLSTALNSMGSRFIMMAYYNQEYDKAKTYYSSLFIGDLALAIVIFIVGIFAVSNLDSLINISPELVNDVKLLILLVLINFLLFLVFTAWSCAPYITDKLHLDYTRNTITTIIRAGLILLLFTVFNPSVYFMGVATLLAGITSAVFNFFYKKKLLPDFKVQKKYFSFKAIKFLISSGIWNTFSSLGSTLISGLDLIITNLFVGPAAMGSLALAKTMPEFVSNLNANVANIFTPSMVIDYAQKNNDSIVTTIKRAAKMISILCSLPLAFLLVFGENFYSLWQPTQDAKTLYILSLITVFGRVFFTGMQPLFSIFTVVNKVKENSIVSLINGLASVIITYLLVKFTNLGVYAVAGTSVVCCAIKNFVYVVPYSAYYLGLKKNTFFSTISSSVLCCLILCALGYAIKLFYSPQSWISLICVAVVFCLIGVVITSFIVLRKEERQYLLNTILSKFSKR